MALDLSDSQGLCPGCRWHRVIENRRGSQFILCERAAWDARLTRYPPLPVRDCVGYEELNASA
ncbi:MAG TPA: hypothetical protein VMH88_06210 [Gemmatimonadales bacterium]|nr:hypothetical protein [Gemmatimonadales bacterium]